MKIILVRREKIIVGMRKQIKENSAQITLGKITSNKAIKLIFAF